MLEIARSGWPAPRFAVRHEGGHRGTWLGRVQGGGLLDGQELAKPTAPEPFADFLRTESALSHPGEG